MHTMALSLLAQLAITYGSLFASGTYIFFMGRATFKGEAFLPVHYVLLISSLIVIWFDCSWLI